MIRKRKRIFFLISVILLLTLVIVFRDFVYTQIGLIRELEGTSLILAALVLIASKGIAGLIGFPGTPLTLLAGAVFGTFWGSIVALIGNTLGAIAGFVLARYVFQDSFHRMLDKYPRLKNYEQRFEEAPFSTTITLRLIPLFPFNALNYALGLTRMSLPTYSLSTFIGIIPGTAAFVYFGESLAMLDPINIAFSAGAVVVLILFGRAYEKRVRRNME